LRCARGMSLFAKSPAQKQARCSDYLTELV
jgi:hypothetical protein